jgi:DNA-binding CsgD family transcriptional regulator
MSYQERRWDARLAAGQVVGQALSLAGAVAPALPPKVAPAPLPAKPMPCSALHGLLGAVLDELDHAVLICAPSGRLLAYNRCARHQLAQHAHLGVVDDSLTLRQGDAQALSLAIRQAAQGRRRLLALGEGEQRQYLACIPLADTHQVLVMLGRERAYSPMAFEMFCAQHQLTHAERRVLQALLDGSRPVDMAEDFGVALSTVRTQVANIRAKLGAARIESLMQMAAGLPPIASLLGDGH